jgi:hypothetical protein
MYDGHDSAGGGSHMPFAPLGHSNLPMGSHLSPYLNIDPAIFKTEPQYILPEGLCMC